MNSNQHIVIEQTLAGTSSSRLAGYLCHALCHEGSCTFRYNGREHLLEAGDCMIVRRADLIEDLRQSDDFKVDAVYVTPEFITLATPLSNYGTIGALALFNNPIMQLTDEQYRVCALDFDYLRHRLALTTHHFHFDAMLNAVQCMIIDFFDFHVQLYGNQKISSQYAQLMEGFIAMLEQGESRRHREIGYYADRLCVTPKYLSEVSKAVSGFPANYWIARYASLDISRLLRNSNLTFAEITDLFGFSSVSYFTRYVQKHLGISPSELRE